MLGNVAVDNEALVFFFETLWEKSSDPFWVVKVDGDDFVIVQSNAAARRVDARQVPGARLREVLDPGPETDNLVETYWRCYEEAETIVTFQEPVLNGQKMRFEAILVPITDEVGLVTHLWGTAKDLTRFVVAENALRLLNEELEERIAERTAELNQAMVKLEQLSLTDPLTGLANRRRFDETLRQEFSRLKRYPGRLSLIMLDIDYFKPYNDNYGHLAGDDCLRVIARTLGKCINRKTDLAVRYGGEEFAIVLPETDRNGAWSVAEQIRLCIEQLAIPNPDSSASPCITVSVGVVTTNLVNIDRPEELIGLADARLYQAKALGRNRCV